MARHFKAIVQFHDTEHTRYRLADIQLEPVQVIVSEYPTLGLSTSALEKRLNPFLSGHLHRHDKVENYPTNYTIIMKGAEVHVEE